MTMCRFEGCDINFLLCPAKRIVHDAFPPQIEKNIASRISPSINFIKMLRNVSQILIAIFISRASVSVVWRREIFSRLAKLFSTETKIYTNKKRIAQNKRPTLNHSLSEIHFLCKFISKGTPAVSSKPPPTSTQSSLSLELQTVNFTFRTQLSSSPFFLLIFFTPRYAKHHHHLQPKMKNLNEDVEKSASLFIFHFPPQRCFNSR